ncbi:MAG: hypothetical protein HQ580_16145 [Planctomycetes bacterium]|nr:hypothetical protein [Planctomycetota bacterium]
MIGDEINMVYDALEGFEDLAEYHDRHGNPGLLILTQHSPQIAQETARLLRPDIEDKRVIEIGAGVGFLAIEMAKYAKSVIAFEVDPAWSWIFTKSLYKHKPVNLSWIFGDAKQFIGSIRGDIAVVFTRSGTHELKRIAEAFAPKVIMPFQE